MEQLHLQVSRYTLTLGPAPLQKLVGKVVLFFGVCREIPREIWQEFFKKLLRVAPIPKANHPNFPHIQSIEYAEHADQPRHAAKHRTKCKKDAAHPKEENAEHAESAQETEKKKRKMGFRGL